MGLVIEIMQQPDAAPERLILAAQAGAMAHRRLHRQHVPAQAGAGGMGADEIPGGFPAGQWGDHRAPAPSMLGRGSMVAPSFHSS